MYEVFKRWRARLAVATAVAVGSSLLLIGQPAQAAETADWLPFQVGSGVVEVGCTWDNGCDGGYHTAGAPAIDFIANVGTPVYAAGPGVLTSYGGCHPTDSEGCNGGAGNYITIAHPDGRSSRYLHLSSIVKANGSVARGELIGYVGNSGGSPVAHLHYDEMVNGAKVDPGLMFANHNGAPAQYPNNLGYASWNAVPAWSDKWVWSSSYSQSPPASQATIVLDYADSVWAKGDGLEYGGWTQETANGSAKAVAAGGDTHLLLDFCDAIWARQGVGAGGWTQETACHSAKAIAVSHTGLQMLLDFCDAVWAKRGVGWGGWVQQTNCHSAKSIAVAGDTQVILNLCNAVWAKQGIGWGGWAEETACNSATSIAVGSTGIQALVDFCGSVWARRGIGYGGWVQQTGCDGHKAIAIGGERQIVINACDAVWAKNGVGWGGWAEETGCGSAKAIAMGSGDRQTILGFDGSVWAKHGIGWSGWVQQAGPWSAKMVNVG